jgi:prepilin-type N-terminal cleavage/methylation domain-containing protein
MDNFTENHRMIFGLRLNLRGGQQGFSMIEILVSISILSVIMAAMLTFLWGASSHWDTGKNLAEMTDNARIGLNRMTRELKQSSQVTEAQTTQVSFKVNFGTGEETITYGYTAGAPGQTGVVWRSTTAAPGQQVTLINDVQSMQLTYYGNDYKCDTQTVDGTVTWSELVACSSTPAAKIARVDFSLTLKSGKESSQTFVEQAWLRNRITSS